MHDLFTQFQRHIFEYLFMDLGETILQLDRQSMSFGSECDRDNATIGCVRCPPEVVFLLQFIENACQSAAAELSSMQEFPYGEGFFATVVPYDAKFLSGEVKL